jgi:hypothetical protein
MAVSNVNVGLGIGMSGETTAPDQIFRAQQQKDLAQTKAAQKKTDEEEAELEQIKKKILLDKPRVHRLESTKVTDEMARTLLTISQAKRTNPNDYLNIAYGEFGKYQNFLNQALSRSANLTDLEDKLQKKSSNVYISSSLQKARDLMNNSETTEGWMENLEKNGIQSSNYFNYDKTTGNFDFQIAPKFDPEKEVKSIYTSKKENPIGLSKGNEKLSDGKLATKFTFKKGVPKTQKEADEIYNAELDRRIAAGESIVGIPTPISGEQIAMNYLAVPEKLSQYVDMYPETASMSEKDLMNHFLKNFYDPYSPYKEENKFFREGKGIQINIGSGDEPASEFLFVDDAGTFAGTDIPYSGLMAVAVKGKYSSGAIILNDVIDMRTKKELNPENLNVASRNVTVSFGQVYVVPVVKEGKTKRLATQAEIDSKKVKPTYEVRAELNFSGLEGLGSTAEAVSKSTTLWPIDKVKSMLYTQGLKSQQIGTLNRELAKAKKKASTLNRDAG